MKTRITALQTALLMALVGTPVAMASTHAEAKDYKVKIVNTTAYKWKVKWQCRKNDGTTKTIDADTYPGFATTTRTTNITSSKCSTGDWWVEFYWYSGSSWNKTYLVSFNDVEFWQTGPENFNSDDKLCATTTLPSAPFVVQYSC